jgi:hypothetical protein
MEHDSELWRKNRDSVLRHLLGDEGAVSFFLRLSNFVEVMDDFVDGDKTPEPSELFDAMHFVLCDLPFNSFFRAYDRELRGQMSIALMSGVESERLRKTGNVTDIAYAFVLRNQMNEMLFTAVSWLRGYEFAVENAALLRTITMNDSFESYVGENT